MLAICAGIAVLFVVVRGDASVRGRERDFVSGDLPTVRMEMRDDFFKESSSPIHLDAASATESQGSTRLVLGAIASDGTPEPGVTAAAASETVAIPEPTVVVPVGDAVERWRPLVASIFPDFAVDAVLRVIRCESGGNPDATGHAGEMGLLQIHPRWHFDATYDPEGNLRAGYRISSGGTDWSAWTCRP